MRPADLMPSVAGNGQEYGNRILDESRNIMESMNIKKEEMNNLLTLLFNGENLARTSLDTQSSRQNFNTVNRRYDKSQQTDINAKDEKGYTELMHAVESGNITFMNKSLNTSGIDVNQANKNGDTALMLAVWNDRVECVQALCNAPGIKLNTKNHLGSTALMSAIGLNHFKCAAVLCNTPGIDADKASLYGDTALMSIVNRAKLYSVRSDQKSAYLNCIEALIKHPKAVIDVKTRKWILNLVMEERYPEFLPYLKLTEGEAQDFMFKIKELREEDKITPEKYFILLINLFAYYPECLSYLKLTEGEAQNFMFKIKELREEDKITPEKYIILLINFFACGHLDISYEEVGREDSESMSTLLEPTLNFQTSNGKENYLVPLESMDSKILQEALDKISHKAHERINANKKKLKPLSFFAVNKILDMPHVQTRPDDSEDTEILQQYSELEDVVTDCSELRLVVDEAERVERVKQAALEPNERKKVDAKQEEQRKTDQAILANKAKKAMKAKQTMSELFVKMQEAGRLSVLKKMSFSSQLEAYIKILFKIHTNDVLKRNPFLRDAIKHTLLDRLFLREQAYNQD